MQQSEQPQRYLVAEAKLNPIGHHKAVRYVADLRESLPFPADLKL